MAALFVGAVFVLGVKLLKPASIQVFVEGSEAAVTTIPGFFTFMDVSLITLSSVLLGVSAMYLLSFNYVSEIDSAGSDIKWRHITKTLKDNELAVYEVILDEGGIILQKEIVEKTGFPKANVTRCLDALENKGILERKRKGMGNIVLLK